MPSWRGAFAASPMKAFYCLILFAIGGISVYAEESPIASPRISADNSAAAVAAAKERGVATASKDIKAGTSRILYYGIPWSVGRPLVDDATGHRVDIVG